MGPSESTDDRPGEVRMSKKSIDDLVAGLPAARHGTECWGKRLDKRGQQFMEGVIAREKTGVKLSRVAIIETLHKEFGIPIGQEALKRHMAGRCACA